MRDREKTSHTGVSVQLSRIKHQVIMNTTDMSIRKKKKFFEGEEDQIPIYKRKNSTPDIY